MGGVEGMPKNLDGTPVWFNRTSGVEAKNFEAGNASSLPIPNFKVLVPRILTFPLEMPRKGMDSQWVLHYQTENVQGGPSYRRSRHIIATVTLFWPKLDLTYSKNDWLQ